MLFEGSHFQLQGLLYFSNLVLSDLLGLFWQNMSLWRILFDR